MTKKKTTFSRMTRNKKALEGDELVDVGSIITFFFLVVLFAILFSITKSCTSTALEEVKTEELLRGLAQQDLDAFLLSPASLHSIPVDVATLIIAAEKNESARSELKNIFASRATMFNDAGRPYRLLISYPGENVLRLGYENAYLNERTIAQTTLPARGGGEIIVEFIFTEEADTMWLLP